MTGCENCGWAHDGWPAKGGGNLCQNCWEADADKSWWDMARQLPPIPAKTTKLTDIFPDRRERDGQAKGGD